MPNLNDICLVFDLDDTLYKEIDYVRSGIAAVLSELDRLGFSVENKRVLSEQELRSGRAIDLVISKLNVPPAMQEALIWVYRLHHPQIGLDDTAKEIMHWAEAFCGGVAIITDGRSFSQRQKLHALGLGHLPAFISAEVGATKPDQSAFLAVQNQWPNKFYVYVADNPAKDFIAPRNLGWPSFGILDDGRNSHAQNLKTAPAQPTKWLHSLAELPDALNGL